MRAALLLLCGAVAVHASNFTIINGQIFTPGLAIVDAPQPDTPEGGDTLQVALDISGDGHLPFPLQNGNQPTQIYNITLFLSSYVTGLNFTISNGTAASNNASLGDILLQEPGSTVKHVDWVWPDCLVGNGPPSGGVDSARGVYNISIRQSFRLNSTNYYTIFDLPIAVTNSIPTASNRPNCSTLQNPLLPPDQVAASADVILPQDFPWTNGNGVQTAVPSPSPSSTSSTAGGSGSGSGSATESGSNAGVSKSASASASSSSATGIGPEKPDAGQGTGLGSGAGVVRASDGMVRWVGGLGLAVQVLVVWWL